MSEVIKTSAILSECGKYRYHLSRWWATGPRVVFVMLNPSKADAEKNDPTIIRCMGFARGWGFAGLDVVNLYAWRATKPEMMWTAQSLSIDIIGPSNDNFLRVVARETTEKRGLLVAAWGANAEPARVSAVARLPYFDRMVHLGLTKAGMPRHPLYLPSDAVPQPFRWTR